MTPYRPLTSNPTAASVLTFNTLAATHFLHETACSRIRIGTDLLETLTSVTIRDIDDQDLYRFINAAFVSLRDGLDMMEEVQHRLTAQALNAT
ncbi:hypothetical protein [Pseudomonas fluorescens]|uniref:DUF3077 domain-containing protein n=1 Tax=Pseudomonas fluorescens TaxID=294 RepID=A0A5E7AWH1_PSEFL|nr:hypothetical protein [Pseudomonas fluorescens]VVN83758.1 hypothetical protein PS691_01299 [Pseudomonas fluorescens]